MATDYAALDTYAAALGGYISRSKDGSALLTIPASAWGAYSVSPLPGGWTEGSDEPTEGSDGNGRAVLGILLLRR